MKHETKLPVIRSYFNKFNFNNSIHIFNLKLQIIILFFLKLEKHRHNQLLLKINYIKCNFSEKINK